MEYIIEINNITKRFNLSKKQQKISRTQDKIKIAVNNLSLKVVEGEIYGLLGPNGAGKTTALRMMSTLITCDEGDIIIDGNSVTKEPGAVRGKIAFLTSELKLEDFFTPNYMYDFYSSLHGVDSETSEKRKEKLFKRFGIDQFAEVKIGDLSTGMKQKASLAISMVHDPNIIIFDEPTNGLDVLTAKIVTDFLLELKAEHKTIILSTHIFSLIEKVCDRVGIIIDGRMIVEEPLSNLCKDKSLEEIFFDIYYKNGGLI